MADGRYVAVTIPHARDEQGHAHVIELEDFCGQVLRPGIEIPDPESPRPRDRADRAGWVAAADVDAIAVPMAADRGLCVLKPLDRVDKVVLVRRIGGVEIERARVAEIALGDEPAENDELVPRP